MISFSKCTAEQYAGLTPVTDRIYYITDTGEIYLNGVKYGSGEITQIQSDWDQSDSEAVDFIKGKPVLAPVATLGTYNSLTGRPAIPVNTGNYFTIASDTTGTCTVTLEKVNTPRDNVLQYNTNTSNDTWYDYTPGTAIQLSQYGYVRWRNKNPRALLSSNTGHWHFTITGNVNLLGNINSLKSNNITYNDAIGAYEYMELFKDNTTIIDASLLELPGVSVGANAYNAMFYGCTGMKHGPRFLPATKLAAGCYYQMFRGCSALEEMPVLADPENCAANAYYQMFSACTSLKEAVLPAVDLGAYSYVLFQMFNWCSSLNSMTVGFTGWGTGTTPTSIWLNNVAANGVFRCNKTLPLIRDVDHIPAAWTVEYVDDPQADWDESDSTLSTYIKNKPAIPAGQIQSNWDESDSTAVNYIVGKEEVDGTVEGVDAFADSMNAYFYGLHKPLTMAIADNSYSNGIRFYRTNTSYEWDLQWSADGGRTWTSFTWTDNTTDTVTIGIGGVADSIMLRGNNPGLSGHGYCYLNTTSRNDANTVVNASGHFNSVLRRERYWMIDDLSTITDSSQGYVAYGFFSDNYTDTRTYWSCNLGDCSGLILGAKKLTQNAYGYMFTMSPMTKGPQMLATDFAYRSCYGMISGGTNLSEIYVDFTTWPGNEALNNWLSGAAAAGVFKCPATLDTSVARSSSTIPANWTIETH